MGCLDGAEKDIVIFSLEKWIEKCLAALWRSVAVAWSGPMCCAGNSGWHWPQGSAVGSSRGEFPRVQPGLSHSFWLVSKRSEKM